MGFLGTRLPLMRETKMVAAPPTRACPGEFAADIEAKWDYDTCGSGKHHHQPINTTLKPTCRGKSALARPDSEPELSTHF